MENESHHNHAHGRMVHEPAAEVRAEYQRVYDEARPAGERQIITVELDARELDWDFVQGQYYRAWGYASQVPGPVLNARVGDVLEVRLKNSLTEPTTIHWHGLRLPAPMDGTENVQRSVPPGDTFTYRFALPDAGTFWYHPHINEPVQLERGLYGALIVRGDNEPTLDGERVLMLHDMSLDRESRHKPRGSPAQHDEDLPQTLRLVNGKAEPELTTAAGQVERWRVVNVSSERYVLLSIGGVPFRILGTDGGLLPTPFSTREVLLAPADRVDLAVGPFAEGEMLRVESLPYHSGGLASEEREAFATLKVGAAAVSRAVIPEILREIKPLVTGPVAATREIRLGARTNAQNGLEFTINDELHHRADSVRLGELQIWDIINESSVDHPFHLHGFFFQVVSVNGSPPEYPSWEDTINIPARARVRIAWMPDGRPGEWMYHCHILAHHAGGMMAHFEILR